MTAPAAEVIAAARALIAYSDVRDRELSARLAFAAEQFAAGREQGDREGAERVLAWHADQDREISEALAAVLARQARPARMPGRWHVCCLACRRGGHRDGCARCEDRTPATFGDLHPDDYRGGPVALLRGAA